MAEIDRRTFLRLLGGMFGVGAVAGGVWALAGGDDGESTSAAPSTSDAPTTSTTSAPTSTTTTTLPETTTTEPAPVEVEIPVIPPEAWGAVPVLDGLEPHSVERLTVHHTAHLMDDNAEAPRLMQSWQQYHQSRGWPDIAYHYLVDLNGHVYAGRDPAFRGDTGTEYDPTGHFLVSLQGNFQEQDVTPEQLASLVDVLAAASQQYGVSPETIAGHKDYAATACPGTALYAYIADGSLEEMVSERAATGPITLSELSVAEATELVADIAAGEA